MASSKRYNDERNGDRESKRGMLEESIIREWSEAEKIRARPASPGG